MAKLEQHLETIVPRTSRSLDLTAGESRNRFLTALTTDLAGIVNQMNNVYYVLFNSLAKLDTADALEKGLSGNVIYADIDASSGSGTVFYDPVLGRKRTLKESLDVLLTQIGELQNSTTVDLEEDWESTATELAIDIATVSKNLNQLLKDTQGTEYTFDNDGNADLTFSLAQHIDAIGTLFTNFPTTGNTYPDSYPTLSFAVNLSDINIDTTIPQNTITDLVTHLANIRTFIGMGTVSETPTYSAHGTVTIVSDGDSLEEAVALLDAAVSSQSHFHRTFVFSPSGAAGGEVYTSWASLYTDLSAITGDQIATVYFDDTPNPGIAFTIPAGSWDMTNVKWTGMPGNTQDDTFTMPLSLYPVKRVTFADGAAVTNLYEVESLQLYLPASVATPITYTSNDLRIIRLQRVGLQCANSSNPLISLTGTGIQVFKCDDHTEIGDGTNPVVTIGATSMGTFILHQNSALQEDAIAGTGDVGGINYDLTCSVSLTHSGLSGSIVGSTIFEDAFVGATALTEGTKGVVPAPAAGEESYILRGDGTWVNFPGGAPASATYVCISTDGTLTDERALAVEAGELTLTDGGAGGAVTLGLADTTVVAGSYTLADITVDAMGRITAAANGSAATSPFATAANVTSNSVGDMDLDDFVFGSDSLADDGNTDHDNRFLFDKSLGAFRAGTVLGTQWDTRGTASAAFGHNCTASSSYSFSTGHTNAITGAGNYGAILGGNSNALTASPNSIILGGTAVTVGSTTGAFVGGVSTATINSGAVGANNSAIVGGATHVIASTGASANAGIFAGTTNTVNSPSGVIVGGLSNVISGGGLANGIFASSTGTISSTGNYNVIAGGNGGEITAGDYQFLAGGLSNEINSTGDQNAIVGGSGNEISAGVSSLISSSASSTISSSGGNNTILSASSALIEGTVTHAVAMGEAVQPLNSFSINRAAGQFAGDELGQIQVTETILYGEMATVDTVLNLTTNGSQTVSAANLLYLPDYTFAHITIEYAFIGLGVGNPSGYLGYTGTYQGYLWVDTDGVVLPAGTVVGDLLAVRSTNSAGTVAGGVGLSGSGTDFGSITVEDSGTDNGFYLAFDWSNFTGSAPTGPVRMVANIRMIQVLPDITA